MLTHVLLNNFEDIEDVIIGCAFPEGEQGFNIGKIVTFLSDEISAEGIVKPVNIGVKQIKYILYTPFLQRSENVYLS